MHTVCACRSVASRLLCLWPVATALFLSAFTSILLFPFFVYVPMVLGPLGMMLPQVIISHLPVLWSSMAGVLSGLYSYCMSLWCAPQPRCCRHCDADAVCRPIDIGYRGPPLAKATVFPVTISAAVPLCVEGCHHSSVHHVHLESKHCASGSSSAVRRGILVELRIHQHVSLLSCILMVSEVV